MAFATNVREKRKSTFPSAIQVKNRRKAISIEENLGVIGQLEKLERIGIFIRVVK
jgi:hypothetical protein